MAKRAVYDVDLKVGDEIPALVKKPTTRQLVKYAGASGDYYEIHYDHHFAVNAGLKEGVIVHGLLTAGWLAQMLTDWLPSPTALKKFGVSYRAMARPGDTITCKGKIVNKYEKDGEHLVDCEISAENQRGEKCAVGTATAALPTRA
ncbi:MAG TPA: MaoC/PaaZ C-terminal domain-containing protein [Gammaproteobacteria bacterium]|nr:MaoC/PaaZ C-terminal domain-containing protein [Gammaproteobacteria bacterium]